MLKPEIANEELKKLKSPDFVRQRLARLAGLPEALRADARTIFNLDDPPKVAISYPWQPAQERRKKMLAAYRAMTAEQLRQLLHTMLPELAPYILSALAATNRLPYTNGWARKPFRAPSRPALLDAVKMDFLSTVLNAVGEYPADIEWIAAWAPHAWPHQYKAIGQLLAGAIDLNDAKGQRVFDILLASAKGEHEVGQMGGHIVAALLIAGRHEGWEFIEKMLLAAQREEGLRQTILEMVDESHPDVFPRFLRVVLEHDLVRFSAIVRAVDTWFGYAWDAISAGKAKQIIEHALRFIDDPAAGDAAIATACQLPASQAKPKGKKLAEADAAVEPAYIALWTKAFADVQQSYPPAEQMLQSANTDVRFAATHLLGQLQLVGGVSKSITARLADSDERVASRALFHFSHTGHYDQKSLTTAVPDLYERLETLLERTPAKTVKLAPIVWPWMQMPWGKETVGTALLAALGDRPATRLLPHLDCFNTNGRAAVIRKLGESKTFDGVIRDTLFAFVGDPSPAVRQLAVEQLKKCTVSQTEALQLEGLLTRKASDLRRGILTLLLNQDDAAALASADRLSQSKMELQRLAGLELLRQMATANRAADACREHAKAFQQDRGEVSSDESTQLAALKEPASDAVTLDNCLGLIDPSTRTPPLAPSKKDVQFVTSAALECLKSLDALVHENRDKPFTPVNGRGEAAEEILLGNARWQFPQFDRTKPAAEQLASLPFREIWLDWFEKRSASMRDADGLELLRADWHADGQQRGYQPAPPPEWIRPIEVMLLGRDPLKLRYPNLVNGLLGWFHGLHPSEGCEAFTLDGLETVLAAIPSDKLAAIVKTPYEETADAVWRRHDYCITKWSTWMWGVADFRSAEDRTRYYRLCRWIDEPGVAIARERPALGILLDAFEVGGANEADIYDHFLGPRPENRYGGRHSELGQFCSLKPREEVQKFPILKTILDRCRKRVLEVEITRGETPTIVSSLAKSLRHSGGMDVLVPFLRAAEKNTFARGHSYGNDSKAVVFSHIIRVTYPADTDTPESFAIAVKEAAIPTERLLELAVYAPQWAAHVEHVLQWPSLSEAVWWIHAHTRDRGWSIDQDLREKWKAEVAQRTPLDGEDLLDGGVDVSWFKRIYEAFGKKRWEAIYEMAKFAGSGGGHTRAQLFADAMLGKLKSKELIQRIESKRHQDSVRALGLLPLPEGDKRKPQVLARYKTLQEFIRTSRQFGSMRQASEKRAAGIGMENLARTAGYADPIRLQWAMEAQACADLGKGPVSQTAGEVTVTLEITADGQPELSCLKKGKTLAAIPPAVKKLPKIAELAERKSELRRSSSRMCKSLEQAMVRGDIFSGEELRELSANPLLSPMLNRLVFVGQGILGYPVDGGQGLADHAGKIEPVKKGESLRLAHPHDLLGTKHWSDWQRDCFARERVQPFKQVFRELYVLTQTEADAKDVSRRYAGHQVQPRQGLALLGSRGWVSSPEQGVFRTFHELGLTAWLEFLQPFFTPADIEGLTLEGIRFSKRSDLRAWVGLADVPPRVFSEVMRDVDLLVSVAHRGEVDPEASASTVQMRTALLSETLQLLNIKNVRMKDTHALIKGELAEYSLHLGSAVTHCLPGGALFIVPIHSQHRGRLFLPFADDDPKTAEVISKVLLLARDQEIKDPRLLSQIRGN